MAVLLREVIGDVLRDTRTVQGAPCVGSPIPLG